MPLVTTIYVLVNLAYFAVVSRDEMLASVAVAVTFGNKVFGPVAWCIPIFVALSCFGKWKCLFELWNFQWIAIQFSFSGGVNGVVFTSARLFATGAQDGHLPSFFSLVHHKQQTPIPSLIFSVRIIWSENPNDFEIESHATVFLLSLQLVISLIMLFTSNVFLLINYFSQILWLSVVASIAALLWLRKTKWDFIESISKKWKSIIIIFFLCILDRISLDRFV